MLPLLLVILTSQICKPLFTVLPQIGIDWLMLTIHGLIIIAVFLILLTLFGVCDKELRQWIFSSIGIKKQPDLDGRVGE